MAQEHNELKSDEQFCRGCGEITSKFSDFCSHCGISLSQDNNEEQIKKSSTLMKIIWSIASILIPLVGFVVGLKYLFTSGRRKYGGFLFCLGIVCVLFWGAIASSADNSGTSDSQFSVTTKTSQQIKDEAVSIEYDNLHRNIESHLGKIIRIEGTVVQVMPKSNDRYDLRIAMNDDYDHMVYVRYKGSRILEEDTLEIWGEVKGLYSYRTIFDAKITLPKIDSLLSNNLSE